MPGLYDDDFAGFRISSTEDLDAALRDAVVATDANVLLGLYRVRESTAADLLSVLERVGERLVVPHQAVREFWRHRHRGPGSPDRATTTALEALTKGATTMSQALERWAKQVGLDPDEHVGLADRLEAVTADLKQVVSAVQREVHPEALKDDAILDRLEALLEGRVTAPLERSEWDQAVTEGRRRVAAKEPPGYKDAEKDDSAVPEGPAGDYLLWYQAVSSAKERDSDLLIVTGDEKEDWWWRQRGVCLGPRPELALEFRRETGHRLFHAHPTRPAPSRAGAAIGGARRVPHRRSGAS